LGEKREVALALEGIGWSLLLGERVEEASALFEESLALQRELGDLHLVNRAQSAVGQALVCLGKVEQARPVAAEIIAGSESLGDRRNEHFGWHYLADCALLEGECAKSLPVYQRSLQLARSLGDRLEISFEVQGVAMSLAGLGRHALGLRLQHAAKAEWARIGVDFHMGFWNALQARYIDAA